MANGNLGNLFGSLTQTLEGIRTTSARGRFFVWEELPEVVNFSAPEGILINSNVTVEPTIVDYIDGPSTVAKQVVLGQTFFGNRDGLGWVIRVGAVPMSSFTATVPSNESIIEYLIGDANGVYTPPSVPTSGPTRYIFAMYAKVVNTRIENMAQARAALARQEDTIQNFTVAEDLYFGNFRVSTNQLLTGITFQKNRNNIISLIMYPQNTVTSMPGVDNGIFYATTDPDALNFDYMWFTSNNQQNINEIRMFESNPNNFPDNPECVTCATGFSCNRTTGLCEPDGGGGDDPWYRRTWFYILIGVVGGLIILGLILGIVFAARKKKRSKTVKTTIKDPLLEQNRPGDPLVREREVTQNKIVLS